MQPLQTQLWKADANAVEEALYSQTKAVEAVKDATLTTSRRQDDGKENI